uniref:hypothetical protein n=1 Tax=Salmonella enterica TaxID=28901 RepID=UPI001C4978E6
IISTINVLFVIGFVGISRKQRPHEGPIKNRFVFVMGITKNRYLANRASLCVESGPHITV